MPAVSARTAAMRWASWTTRVVIVVAAVAAVVVATATVPPVRAVPHVDPERYAGLWYEMARAPNRFQDRCAGEVTATYQPLPDGSISVTNRCREADDRWAVAVGRAWRAKDDASNARLKVSFLPGWLQWVPGTKADYWVVMLDADYRYVVVSEPSREYLWILSRSPTLDAATYEGIVVALRQNGYPVDSLVPTRQRPRGESMVPSRVRLLV